MNSNTLNRRNFIKGLAASLALPQLPGLAAEAKSSSPARLAYLYVPNGVNIKHWQATPDGTSFTLPASLKPLAPLKKDLQIIRGLDLDTARANGDGPGDHARANASFLTGCQARKTSSMDLRLGTSVDQIAAQAIGNQTRLSSLELSTSTPRRAGSCDSGYSCAYQFNLSWSSPDTPVPATRNPRRVFERLFGSGDQKADARRRAERRSVLDFVKDDARRYQNRIGKGDSEIMSAYLDSIRGLERRIEKSEYQQTGFPHDQLPKGVPSSYQDHIRLMADLMVLAFKTDSTRICTFGLAHDGSNRRFTELGIISGHHNLSHHRGDKAKLRSIAKIDEFYIRQLSYFLESLKSENDATGNLLDNTMVLYGSGIGDGNRHNHDDLPIILAGGKNLGLNPGRLWSASSGTPLTNLHLALLDKMQVEARRVGDSTGVLDSI